MVILLVTVVLEIFEPGFFAVQALGNNKRQAKNPECQSEYDCFKSHFSFSFHLQQYTLNRSYFATAWQGKKDKNGLNLDLQDYWITMIPHSGPS
jgi:hypothetical protein